MKCLIFLKSLLNNYSSGGQLVGSLFEGFPKENLRVVVPYSPFIKFVGLDKEPSYETRFISASGKNVRFYPVDKPVRDSEDGNRGNESVLHRTVKLVKSIPLLKKAVTQTLPLRETILSWSFMERAFRNEIREFRPDIVYAGIESRIFAELAFKACSKEKVPLFIQCFDDYVEAVYRSKPFAKHWMDNSTYWFQKSVDYATGHAGCYVYMAEEYARRYGGDWCWFTALLSKDACDPTPRTDGLDEIRLFYPGYARIGRIEVLKCLADSLLEISNETGKKIRFDIRLPHDELAEYGDVFQGNPVVTIDSWVTPELLPKMYHDSDILVHVESTSPEYVSHIKYSLSTKLSWYMLAGRCLLSIGPEELSSCRTVKDLNVGFHIAPGSKEEIKTKLLHYLMDRDMQAQYGRNARQKGIELFDMDLGTKRFKEELEKAVTRFRQR